MFTTVAFSFKGYPSFQNETHVFPEQPGVYRFLSGTKEILYVGKARNLRKRLQSYAKFETLTLRLRRLVLLISEVVVTTTQTETEALLLEASLIREHKPRFNVLLKDDKSFPSLLLSKHVYPRLMKYRGTPPQGVSFGPFLSSSAVDMMVEELAKIFRIRTCTDVAFSNRRRPCLRFDIKRCSGPCVQRIAREDYQENVQAVIDILSGKSHVLQQQLEAKMQQAAQELRYEAAAVYRDQIQAISKILTRQEIYHSGFGDLDIVVLAQEMNAKIAGFFVVSYRQNCFRGEYLYCFDKGDRFNSFDKLDSQEECFSDEDLLPLFVNLYKANSPPGNVLVSDLSPSAVFFLKRALSIVAGYTVDVICPQRGEKARAVIQSKERAKKALEGSAEAPFDQTLFTQLARVFSLSKEPESIEIYDNSHLRGQFPYGVKVVATTQGFQQKRYRRFPITASPTQDDCAMLEETLRRRFLMAEEDPLPDLLLIDGGKGQLSAALRAITTFSCATNIAVIAVAKGPERNAGKERFFSEGQHMLTSDKLDKPLLFFLQRLRDEAHRFAITTHRRARTRNVRSSLLDQIPGIGNRRKQILLRQFGSLRGLQEASLADLEHVPGIGLKQAKIVWSYLHKKREEMR
jgi:excinuclease ABC subunit C